MAWISFIEFVHDGDDAIFGRQYEQFLSLAIYEQKAAGQICIEVIDKLEFVGTHFTKAEAPKIDFAFFDADVFQRKILVISFVCNG